MPYWRCWSPKAAVRPGPTPSCRTPSRPITPSPGPDSTRPAPRSTRAARPPCTVGTSRATTTSRAGCSHSRTCSRTPCGPSTPFPSSPSRRSALGDRAGLSEPTEIAFRTPDEPDVVLTLDPAGSRFSLTEQATDPALVLTLQAHHRPLVPWGRRPAAMAPAIEGDRGLLAVLEHIMWPDATLWP